MIAPGQQVLHYRIVEKIGEGGMGVVWSATDTTLGRPVAIKVLPPAFAADSERLARFEREARVLASLNHPNIATVYSVHVVDGDRCLTMELVPGEDLALRIARGPVPVPEALELGRQVALALEAAHENGVVHRDLKPANVRVTPDGRVKVLDFGLAKALEASAPASALSQSPTLVGSVMGSGAIIGTAAYMSPEQARGQTADRRADIWAFGVVLYEMLTGRRAFEGETVSDTLAAVLRAEPDRSLLPADLSPRVRSLLDRCLEKSPRARLRDIGEALLVIEAVLAGGPEAAAESRAPSLPPRGVGRERLLWGAALVAVAAVAGLIGITRGPAAVEPPLRKYGLTLRDEVGEVISPVVSPDGGMIAFLLGRRLWVRDLSQLASRPLAEGLDEDFRPLWSHDSESIVFGTATGLYRVTVSSGTVSPVCAVPEFSGGSGGTWTPDGDILFTRGVDHIYRVAGGGGVPVVLHARVDSTETDLHHPYALPGGRAVLFVRHLSAGGGSQILALLEKGRARDLLRLPSGTIWEPVYDPRGYIVFTRLGEGAGVWALPFSLERLQVTGEAFLIVPQASSCSIAADGTLVHRMGQRTVESVVVSVSRSGAVLDTLTEPLGQVWSIALSPDERMLALETRRGGDGDVWVHDLERRAQTRFAFGPARQSDPVWSPDGRELAWTEQGVGRIMARPADGSQAERWILRGFFPRYSPDGRYLLYGRFGDDTANDIWYATRTSPPDTFPLLHTPADESFPVPSPGGQHLVYSSSESGRPEIYLRQFPEGDGRWQVSTSGGARALWNRVGDRIYYWNGDQVFEVPVETQPAVRLGTPRLLFDLAEMGMQTNGRFNCAPTSDPDRFLMLQPKKERYVSPADVVVVQNWHSEFARK